MRVSMRPNTLSTPLVIALTVVFAVAAISARASTHKPAESPYAEAQHARESLEARPEAERTRRDYERVLELYRAIYHDDPASPKADASIFAVAQLLSEQGRVLHDEKSLLDAIGQYEFLRREYPTSHYRADALLAEGDIYFHDLNDSAEAKTAYQAFLKQYPHNAEATEARANLKELHTDEVAAKHSGNAPAPIASRTAPASTAGLTPPVHQKHSNTVLTAAIQSQQTEPPPSPAPAMTPPPITRTQTTTSLQPTRSTSEPVAPAPSTATTHQSPQTTAAPVTQPVIPSTYVEPPHRKGKLVQVSGVRHWSTSIYTRVAIDLGDEVQYEAARVPDPDRIFFDLHGTRLSPELIGKSVSVIDDGFLKRIRIAQFSNDVTRVVLDVSDVSDYSAFLLPNPYRLIIDIHGRKPGAPPTQQVSQSQAPTTATPEANAAKRQPATPLMSSASPPSQALKPSATVVVTNQNSPSTDAKATQDIAALSHQPDRVKATNHPTSAPIAASVAGTTPASQPELTQAKPATTRSFKHSKPTDNPAAADAASPTIHEAEPTADGGRSMVRALGLKIGRIVIDPGHGGHDSGTLGPDGIEEKDVVLDVSLRLGKLLKQRLGADVIFTRSDDTFIPLETRTAIANKAQADLFVSVHANSSPDPSARGVETYYLNFTSSPESLELAARENAVSQQSIHQLSDLVKKIALHDKIDESREFASDVEKYLYDGLDQGNPGLKDRGVKQAPFVVLIGANMPSILAEISFLTNPDDASELRDPNYRQRIAESLYRGIARYVSGLSGVRIAETSSHLPGN
jgi:N-acetylmuramoyl-L-alanine amidase